jgi:hypothetical protein
MRPDSRSESGGCPHVEMGWFGAVQLDTVRSTAPDGSLGARPRLWKMPGKPDRPA